MSVIHVLSQDVVDKIAGKDEGPMLFGARWRKTRPYRLSWRRSLLLMRAAMHQTNPFRRTRDLTFISLDSLSLYLSVQLVR